MDDHNLMRDKIGFKINPINWIAFRTASLSLSFARTEPRRVCRRLEVMDGTGGLQGSRWTFGYSPGSDDVTAPRGHQWAKVGLR